MILSHQEDPLATWSCKCCIFIGLSNPGVICPNIEEQGVQHVSKIVVRCHWCLGTFSIVLLVLSGDRHCQQIEGASSSQCVCLLFECRHPVGLVIESRVSCSSLQLSHCLGACCCCLWWQKTDEVLAMINVWTNESANDIPSLSMSRQLQHTICPTRLGPIT